MIYRVHIDEKPLDEEEYVSYYEDRVYATYEEAFLRAKIANDTYYGAQWPAVATVRAFQD